MKTFIPHVYFSAPEDTVGDLVNQIRRESEIPGTAEPKPEMKDSGKKSIIPKTVVSAPEKDTVGDLIEQLHKEPEAIPEEKPEEKTEQPEKTEGKKSIIPKTVVSAAKSELDRVYDLLTSGEDLQMNPDGTLSPASAPKKRAKPAPGSEPKAPVKTKKEIIPHTVVSAPEKDTVGDLIEQLHKEPEPLPEERRRRPTERNPLFRRRSFPRPCSSGTRRTRRFITQRSPPCARNSTTRTCSRILCQTAACTGL